MKQTNKINLATAVLMGMTGASYAAETFQSGTVYTGGNQVVYNGQLYQAKYWTNQSPTQQPDAWRMIVAAGESHTWNSNVIYVGGDEVLFNGNIYRAKWWTQGDQPGQAGVWEVVGTSDVTPEPQPEPIPTPTPQPELPPADGNAQAFQFGKVYHTGDVVEKDGKVYRCLVAGWCSNIQQNGATGLHYTPGTGISYTEAWALVGNASDQPQPEPTPEPQPEPTPTPQPDPQPTPEPTPEPAPVPNPQPNPNPNPQPTPSPVTPAENNLPNPAYVGYWHASFNNGAGSMSLLEAKNTGFNVIPIAFGLIDKQGNVTFDLKAAVYQGKLQQFKNDIKTLQAAGIKVILAIGGEGAHFDGLKDQQSVDNFVNSLQALVNEYGFDGVDLDHEDSAALSNPAMLNAYKQSIIQLRQTMGKDFIITITPFAVHIYDKSVGSPENNYVAGAYNVYRNIFSDAAVMAAIDAVQPMAYNDWVGNCGGTWKSCQPGTQEYLERVYTNYANAMIEYGVNPQEKLIMGMLSSESSGVAGHATTNEANQAFVQCVTGNGPCVEPNVPKAGLRGVMTWSINWDIAEKADFATSMHSWFDGIEQPDIDVPTPTPTPNPQPEPQPNPEPTPQPGDEDNGGELAPINVAVNFNITGLPLAANGDVTFTNPKGDVLVYTIAELRNGIELATNDYAVSAQIAQDGMLYQLSTAQISVSQGGDNTRTLAFVGQAMEGTGMVVINIDDIPANASNQSVRILGKDGFSISQPIVNGKVQVQLQPGTYKFVFEGFLDNATGQYFFIPTKNYVLVTADHTVNIDTRYTVDSSYQRVEAYYAAWATYGRNHQISDVDAQHLDVLYYAFLDLKPNGEVVSGDSFADFEKRFPAVEGAHGSFTAGDWMGNKEFYGNLERIQQLKAIAKERYNNDIKAVFSIGGWTWSGNFEAVADDPAKRANFVRSAVQLVQKYDMDGLDLDWEFSVWGNQNEHINRARTQIAAAEKAKGAPLTEAERQTILDANLSYKDADNYVKLMRELRTGLNELSNITGKQYHLSLAINQAPENILLNSYGDMEPYIDSINLMTYDTTGSWDSTTGNQSALNGAEGAEANHYGVSGSTWNLMDAVDALRAVGIPNHKIVAGLPLYGRQWQNVPAGNGIPGLYQSGEAGVGEWEAGNLGYNCLMGQTFSEMKTQQSCAGYGNTANLYTYILVRDNSGQLKAVSDRGSVTNSGYYVDGQLYDFKQVIASYYYNPETKVFITYDSPTMVNIKGRWIQQQGLGGGMFWDTSGDVPMPATNVIPSLIETLSNSFADPQFSGSHR